MTKYKVYCDESRIDKTGYTLIGGIWVPEKYVAPFISDYSRVCQEHPKGQPHRLKWTKTPPKPDALEMRWYTDMVDLFFEYMEKGCMSFRVIIVDETYDFAHPGYNQKDYETGFYKLYYQLIVHTLEPQNQYALHLASRSVSKKSQKLDESYRLSDLKRTLNSGCRKMFGHQPFADVVTSVEARDESSQLPIQLADLLTGAVGYHWVRGHLEPQARLGKIFLANYIATKLGRETLRYSTSSGVKGFNIFRHRPQERIMRPGT